MKSSIISLCFSSAVALCATALSNQAIAEEIRVLSWNVESDRPGSSRHFADGNTPATIAAELTALQQINGPYDLIALTEVLADNADIYEAAAEAIGKEYLSFVSETGGTDRMVILVDEERFTVNDGNAVELESHESIDFPGGSARRPMFVQLEDSENNGLDFIFMVNHLTRNDRNDNRRIQAQGLREWAADQSLPIIAAGDYNFDFNFRNLTGNQAMAIFLDDVRNGDSVWDWVIPTALIETVGTGADERTLVMANFVDTNWADNNRQTNAEQRVDRFAGSILDFIFVAQEAREWPAQSRVIVRENDFPDTADTSDHRPVEAIFDPTSN